MIVATQFPNAAKSPENTGVENRSKHPEDDVSDGFEEELMGLDDAASDTNDVVRRDRVLGVGAGHQSLVEDADAPVSGLPFSQTDIGPDVESKLGTIEGDLVLSAANKVHAEPLIANEMIDLEAMEQADAVVQSNVAVGDSDLSVETEEVSAVEGMKNMAVQKSESKTPVSIAPNVSLDAQSTAQKTTDVNGRLVGEGVPIKTEPDTLVKKLDGVAGSIPAAIEQAQKVGEKIGLDSTRRQVATEDGSIVRRGWDEGAATVEASRSRDINAGANPVPRSPDPGTMPNMLQPNQAAATMNDPLGIDQLIQAERVSGTAEIMHAGKIAQITDQANALRHPMPPTDFKAISSQIVAKLSSSSENLIEIRLDPVELGKIKFQISSAENAAKINIFAERPEVVDLLRRNESLLERELSSLGFAGFDLEFSQNPKEARDQHAEAVNEEFAMVAPDTETIHHASMNLPLDKLATTQLDIRL